MYSLFFLSNVIAASCIHNFIENKGDYCVIDPPRIPVVKYYEPGKSCYVNGTFYTKCEEANGTF